MKPVRKESLAFERLLFFSDAVFAIAVTLLAIDIRLGDDVRYLTDGDLLRALLALWPKYLSFLISFYVISRYWASHHRIFRFVNKFDDRLLSINIVFLLSVVIIPFPTTVLGNYTLYRYAVVLYGSTLFLPGLILLVLWLYATKDRRCLDSEVGASQMRSIRRRFSARLAIPPIIFAVSVGVSFCSTIAAISMWAALGPALFVLGRVLRIERSSTVK
jgi:uncharacterized membrane protein